VTDQQFRIIEAINQLDDQRRALRPAYPERQPKTPCRARLGTTVQEVNDLLSQFRQMQRLMKQMGSGGRGLRGGLMDLFR